MSAAKKQKTKNGSRATKKKRDEDSDDEFDDFEEQQQAVRVITPSKASAFTTESRLETRPGFPYPYDQRKCRF